MPFDKTKLTRLHAAPQARIIFSGVYLFCLNNGTRCEVQRVDERFHFPTFTIYRITKGADGKPTEEPITVHGFDKHTNVGISIADSSGAVVKRHPEGAGPLDRLSPTAPHDDRSFDWILDFEKDLCSNQKVKGAAKSKLTNTIIVHEGTIYAGKKNGKKLFKKDATSTGSGADFGEIAEVIVVDIVTTGSGIKLTNTSLPEGAPNREAILPFTGGVTYDIVFNNECRLLAERDESIHNADLAPFYDCLTLPTGVKKQSLSSSRTFDQIAIDLALAPCPHPCLGACLGVTPKMSAINPHFPSTSMLQAPRASSEKAKRSSSKKKSGGKAGGASSKKE